LDGVSIPVTEEIEADQRGGAILSRQRELPPERRAVTRGAALGDAHDRQLVAEQGRVRGHSGERRLAASGGPCARIGLAVPDGTLWGRRLSSMRQSAGPDEVNPLNRSRTTPATFASGVMTAARRPAIPMLSSATERSAPDAPESEGERQEPRKHWREKRDRAV